MNTTSEPCAIASPIAAAIGSTPSATCSARTRAAPNGARVLVRLASAARTFAGRRRGPARNAARRTPNGATRSAAAPRVRLSTRSISSFGIHSRGALITARVSSERTTRPSSALATSAAPVRLTRSTTDRRTRARPSVAARRITWPWCGASARTPRPASAAASRSDASAWPISPGSGSARCSLSPG